MKVRFKVLFVFFLVVVRPASLQSQPSGIDFSSFLQESLENDQFQIRVQAAEALIRNNFPISSQQIFSIELEKNGIEKIGALSILASENYRDSIKHASVGKEILHQFREATDDHTRRTALEALAELGWYSADVEILEIARSGEGGIKSLARWVLSNSGNPEDLTVLVELLSPSDSAQFRYAASALREKANIPEPVYLQMKEKFENIEIDHPLRIFLISALWAHAREEDRIPFKKHLLPYLNAEVHERAEVYEALSRRGSKEDLATIRDRFTKEANTGVKVLAAKAYLVNEHHLQYKVGWPDWIILVTYGIVLLTIGWYYSYFQKNKEDYFLGGRKVNPFISGISMYVSFFSAISYLAIAGEVIKYGPVIAIVNIISAPLIFILGSYFLIPYFMNLKIISAYEILEKPLGKSVRKLASLIFVATRLIWMALLIYLAGKTMVVMMGWNDELILLITMVLGIITVLYTTMGGLKAVLTTDLIQFIILLFGAVLTIAVVVINFGGFGSIIPSSWSENWSDIEFFNFNPYVRLTIFFALINNITWWICTTGADQMAIQRFVSTKNLKSARKSFLITQTGQVVIIIVLVMVGLSVMQFYRVSPNLLPQGIDFKNNSDFLFPNFIANQFPTGMSGLVMAALFSASMSSLSSGINSVTSVLTTDIFPDSLLKNDSDSLKMIRLTSSATGILVILLSMTIPIIPGNIIEVTAKTNGLFIAPLFNLFFMALFIKKARPFGVICGSLYGLLTAFTIAFWDVLTGNPPWSFLWIGILSLTVSIISSFLFSILLPRISGKRILFWGFILLLPWIILYSVILH